jgi:hypothetical protein
MPGRYVAYTRALSAKTVRRDAPSRRPISSLAQRLDARGGAPVLHLQAGRTQRNWESAVVQALLDRS